MARRNQSGSVSAKSGSARVYRGSHKRLQRITLRGNWSVEVLVAALSILLTLLILIPTLIHRAADLQH
jgi:hypothetical protein